MYRSIIREGIRFASCAVLALALTPALAAQSSCPNGVEIALINGRIHTMDASNGVVSAVTMRGGKFVSVGHARCGRRSGSGLQAGHQSEWPRCDSGARRQS